MRVLNADDRFAAYAIAPDRGERAIRVSSNAHWLEFRGRPILPIGDSITHGWSECGTDLDQEGYLDALASRGMNVVLLWSYSATSRDKQLADRRIGYDAPELWPWTGSADRKDVDLTEFNPAYFERLHAFVRYAESKNILVVITVQDGWPKTHFAEHPFNAELGNGPLTDRGQFVVLADYDREVPRAYDTGRTWQQKNQFFQERFADRLCSELADCSNVIFEMFNEGEWYDREQRRRHEEHFLRFFRKRTAAPLMTNLDHIHAADYQPRQRSDVDIVSLHKKPWTGQYEKFVREFRHDPARVIIESEPVPSVGGLEPAQRGEAVITPQIVRSTVWERALAGAGFIAQNDTSFSWNRKCAMNRVERVALRDEVYDILGHCARFFNDSESPVRFCEMSPHGELSSTRICLADPKRCYVVYNPAPGKFTLDLSGAEGQPLNVRWYNPANGQSLFIEQVAKAAGDAQFAPPFDGDAVLHLWVNESQ